MKRWLRLGSVMGLLALAVSTGPAQAVFLQKEDGSPPWVVYNGDWRITPALPDELSAYGVFTFRLGTGDYDMFRIKGEFPHARYLGFSMADFESGNSDPDPGASIVDQAMLPDDERAGNPFAVNGDRETQSRSYTLWVVKPGVVPPGGREGKNVIEINTEFDLPSVFFRIYRPDNGYDLLGGTTPPTVEALKADGSPAVAPEFGLSLIETIQTIRMFLFNDDLLQSWDTLRAYAGNTIVAHRLNDAGLFPNVNNRYVMATLPQDYFGTTAAVATFMPPTFEDTYEGGPFVGGKQVRYYSVCLGGLGETGTADCLADDQLRQNADGTVTVIVAPLYLKGAIEAKGFNFINWSPVNHPVLVLRNLLADTQIYPSWTGSVPDVPRPIPASENLDAKKASLPEYMGPYAPTGKIYTSLAAFGWWLAHQ